MTSDELIVLVESPSLVEAAHEPDLRDWVKQYPYFSQARVLWLRSALLATGGSVREEELEAAALQVNDLRQLFFYLYPEMLLSAEPTGFQRSERYTGSYFDILDAANAEGGETNESLRKIAQRLKESRSMMQKSEPPAVQLTETEEMEQQVSRLIQDANYRGAIEILKQLNLINPKKSIYFADQIRFLEKIIENIY